MANSNGNGNGNAVKKALKTTTQPTISMPHERPYMLVLHRRGYDRTQLTRYAYLDRAITAGTNRLLRGGDWFQVINVEPEIELAKGSRDGVTGSYTWTQRAQREVRQQAPLYWPEYLSKPKRGYRKEQNDER